MLLYKAILIVCVIFITGCQATADVVSEGSDNDFTAGVIFAEHEPDDPEDGNRETPERKTARDQRSRVRLRGHGPLFNW